MRVLIIGAGTGGLALAHALKRANIEVAIFERDLVPNADSGGYRVGISPAGSRALKACLPSELHELFTATCARAPRYFSMLTEQLTELLCFELDLTSTPDGEKNVIRKTLRRVLLRGLENQVNFGKAFGSYSESADGAVTVRFEDESSATGDLLIGADGSQSAVRRQRLPQARLQDTGLVSLGGQLPMTPRSRALLSEKMFYGMSMIMAPKGFGAIVHSLEFAPVRGNPKFASRWPDFADAFDEDSIGWGLWGARQNFPQDPSGLRGEALLRIGLEVARSWHPNLRALMEMTHASSVHCLGVRTSAPLSPWTSSNVTLLGDAVHTMTPGRGAGANTALRDAALLSRELIDASRGRKPLLRAIADYETEMRRYSTEAVIASRRNMDSTDSIHKPVVGALQLRLMRSAMRVVNAVPPFKRRALHNIMRIRGEN